MQPKVRQPVTLAMLVLEDSQISSAGTAWSPAHSHLKLPHRANSSSVLSLKAYAQSSATEGNTDLIAELLPKSPIV